jgi:hypothetical protein
LGGTTAGEVATVEPATFVAVIRHCTAVSSCASPMVNVDAVAPETSAPSLNHWNARMGFSANVPGSHVSVCPFAGVPAIDGMTLAFPVPDTGADPDESRWRFLARMKLAFDDARKARTFGMSGKWVGHPAQLFAVLLAFEQATPDATIEADADAIESYRLSNLAGVGASIVDGAMSDRATDRGARGRLRKATALGRFDPSRALALGVIDPQELVDATAWWTARTATG